MPVPQLGAGAIMLSACLSICASVLVHPKVRKHNILQTAWGILQNL